MPSEEPSEDPGQADARKRDRGRPPRHPGLGARLAARIWPRASAGPLRARAGAGLRRLRRYLKRDPDPPR